jgi:hypothetical protein
MVVAWKADVERLFATAPDSWDPCRPLSISHDGTTPDDLLLMDILWSDPTDRPASCHALPTATHP